MTEYRPWHLPGCPARDARTEILGNCTCPPEQFLDEFARPVYEAGDGPGRHLGGIAPE